MNFLNWVEENSEFFLPPICNKLMFGGFLKVMFVGGPNQRTDFHVELGEELFYMVKGDMCLRVMECGVMKDIVIREGEIFLLPPRIPHSPQRFENTVGLVVERERDESEIDCMRWYTKDYNEVLYEEWFHCVDLVINLPPIVERFRNSDQYRTGIPSGIVHQDWPIDDKKILMEPFSLSNWIESHKNNISLQGLSIFPDDYEFHMVLIGEGDHENLYNTEVLYWQWDGGAEIFVNDEFVFLKKNDYYLINSNLSHKITIGNGGLLLEIKANVKKLI